MFCSALFVCQLDMLSVSVHAEPVRSISVDLSRALRQAQDDPLFIFISPLALRHQLAACL
jgi:hypothetical protein